MSFQWFEIYVLLGLIVFLGLIMWRKVMGFRYFFPIVIGYWLMATVANLCVGEHWLDFLADAAALLGFCYYGYRARTN